MQRMPSDPGEAGTWVRTHRLELGWSGQKLADVINLHAREDGYPSDISQQSVSKFEQGDTKRMPAWVKYAEQALTGDELSPAHSDDDVEIQQWHVAYGMGGGTYLDIPVTGETHKFSRSWLRQFTHAPPEKIFLAAGTGDSMTPTILNSDIVLIDTSETQLRVGDKIWAVAYGETGLIKRLRRMPDGSVKMLSDNPVVDAETAYDGELTVVGRVVAVVRKI